MHFESAEDEGEKWTAAKAAGDGEETGNGMSAGLGEKDMAIRDGAARADEDMATRGEVADPEGGGGNQEALTHGARAEHAREDTRTTLGSVRATGKPERRMIEPVHLACVDNGWYLFAYDPSRGKIRRFLLTRVEGVRVTGRTFKPRAFDIDEAMAPSFGIFDGDGVPVNLRIQFRGKGVRLIEERSWHPS